MQPGLLPGALLLLQLLLLCPDHPLQLAQRCLVLQLLLRLLLLVPCGGAW